MHDEQIVELYWNRDESAISKTEEKYGHYLTKIAYNILADLDDSLESVNDTYYKAWNSMPPHKPCILSAYLGKITRELSIDIFRKRNRKKRIASEYAISFSELDDCISVGNNTEESVDVNLLSSAINTFLHGLPPKQRVVFVGRYYYGDSIADISKYYDMSESKVKSMLYRTRIALRTHLEKEGFFI